MANLVQELLIKIGLKADTAEAVNASKAIGDIAAKSKQAGSGVAEVSKGSKDMARGLGEGAAAGNAAVAAMSQVSAASQGGAQGLLALARAGFAAGVSMKAVMVSMGPFGAIAAAIGVVLGVVSLALKKSEDAAAGAKTKMDELNKSNLEALKTQLAGVVEEARKFKDELEEAARAKERIADVKLADTLATIKASDLSPEQKDRAESAARRAREDEKRADAQKLLDDKADADAKTAARLAQVELDRAAAEAIATGKKERLDKAEKELESAYVAIQAGGEGGLGAGLGDYEKANAALAERDAAKRAAGVDIDGAIKTAEEARRDATEKRRKADEDAEKSAAIAKRERETQREEDPYIANARKQTNKAAAKGPGENAAFEKEKERLSRQSRSVIDNQVASGGYTNEAAYTAIYGQSAWDKFSPSGRAASEQRKQQVGESPAMPGSGGTIQQGDKTYSGGKDGVKELNATMKEAGEKAGEKVDLQPAVDGAKAVQEGNEQLRTALTDATSAQSEAMQAARDSLNEASVTLGDHAGAIRAIKSELASIKAQMRASKTK